MPRTLAATQARFSFVLLRLMELRNRHLCKKGVSGADAMV